MYMKRIYSKIKLWLLLIAPMLSWVTQAHAQCLPPIVISDNVCSRQFTQFRMDPASQIGATNILWDFGGLGTISDQTFPGFQFDNPGTYTITLTFTDAAGNPCTQTLDIVVKPSPVIDIDVLTPREQCFEGNEFTVMDRSQAAPGSFIKRVKHVAAGTIFEQVDPNMPYVYNFSTADPAGGFYDIDVEIEDANGCISVETFPAYLEVKAGLGLSFTSDRPEGCDSVTMSITNNSLIPLSQIARFEWDFGDGVFDSTNWGPQVRHTYYTQGPNGGRFRACLRVTDISGCRETFCFDAAATNLILRMEIVPSPDSTCFEESDVDFDLVVLDSMNLNDFTFFTWVFGDPDTGPLNFDDRSFYTTTHNYSKVGPFLTNFIYNHRICGARTVSKQIQIIGPQSDIPGPDIPLNQRYQCRSQDTVFFPNESVFFHNDRNFGDDALGFFDTDLNMWIYDFDTASQVPTNDGMYDDNRGKDCALRIWDFDDEYAPTCTTDFNPIYPQRPEYNNMHMSPDPVTNLYPRNTYYEFPDTIRRKFGVDTLIVGTYWVNCRYSYDSLPKHFFTDWEDIFWDSFVAQNRPLRYAIIVEDSDDPRFPEDGCYEVQADTTDMIEYRRQFYLQIPRCFTVRLKHVDTCHALRCEDEATTSIAIMEPKATGLQKDGRFCFGTPPNFGVTFLLDETMPGCTRSEAYINPDTALNPNNWIPYYPGGESGTYVGPDPIMPYDMSGPYPNDLFFAYANPGFIKDTRRGYAHVGLIVANGVGDNRCVDTAYYENFIKFPVIDNASNVVLPEEPLPGYTNVFKLCRWDSLVMEVDLANLTVPYDADQIAYTFQRIAPDENELRGRYPFYSNVIFENYVWFQPRVDPNTNQEYLENMLIRTQQRTFGNSSETLRRDTIITGRVNVWETEADVTQVRDILEVAFDNLGFTMSAMTAQEIADAIRLKCIDTTGLGDFIQFYINPIEIESFHFRDTTIFPLDTFRGNTDFRKNAYTFIAEENGIFNFNFQVRSRIGGCLTQRGNRVIVGFYNDLVVEDSIICREDVIEGEIDFKYWFIDPDNNPNTPPFPSWMDPTDYWGQREDQAGQDGIEGLTKWDWSEGDDDPNDPQTIFGSAPYGKIGYVGPHILGGTSANRLYYDSPGLFNMRVAAEDSMGCHDTLYQNIYATQLFAEFDVDSSIACVAIITLLDSSFVLDPCDSALGRSCDEIIEWYISWGDGKRDNFFDRNTYPPNLGLNIGHNYTRNGEFEIKLKVKSLLGCEDSITKIIIIDGPIPEFVTDTIDVCVNDSIVFYNLSDKITPRSAWLWNFGDNTFRSELFADYEDSFKNAYSEPGVYEVYLTMFDSVGQRVCGYTYPDTIGGGQLPYIINVRPRDTIEISANRDTICPGETINFTVEGSRDYIEFLWNFDADNGNVSETQTTTDRTTSFQYLESGVYMVTVQGIPDPALVMCPDVDTMYIFVDTVKADFEIDSSRAPVFCFTNTSANAENSRWGFFHTTDITETAEEFKEDIETDDIEVCQNYVDRLGIWMVCLIVENAGGCEDTICKEVRFNRLIKIPNVFTPGQDDASGDGLNDFFEIPIVGHDLFELTIRNRWGDVVFRSEDSDFQWNGKVNNTGAQCPDGTYIYMLRYRFAGQDDIEDVSGIVTLLRERNTD